MHTFCDASQKAYSAVSYWRFLFENGDIHTLIILSNSRVAPSAIRITSRIAKLITKEHAFKINRRIFWSDSQTVLQWINSDSRTYKTFVMNRLGEINEETNVTEWKWAPTTENPADDAKIRP